MVRLLEVCCGLADVTCTELLLSGEVWNAECVESSVLSRDELVFDTRISEDISSHKVSVSAESLRGQMYM